MDRLIEQFFGEQVPDADPSGNPPTYYLPVDIFESEEAYTLVASVPGFKQDHVEITFEDGILTIKAKAEGLKTPGRWLRQERPFGSFVRRLEVPSQVETGKIEAQFDNGELTVTIPDRGPQRFRQRTRTRIETAALTGRESGTRSRPRTPASSRRPPASSPF